MISNVELVDRIKALESLSKIEDIQVPLGACVVWFGDIDLIPSNYIKAGLGYLWSDYQALQEILYPDGAVEVNSTGFTFTSPSTLTKGVWIMRAK